MKVTIIPVDSSVTINGVGFSGLDLSFIPNNVHAVQWYDTFGEVEIKDTVTGKMISNDNISSLDFYQPAIDAWNLVKLATEQAAIKKAEEDRIAEEQSAADAERIAQAQVAANTSTNLVV